MLHLVSASKLHRSFDPPGALAFFPLLLIEGISRTVVFSQSQKTVSRPLALLLMEPGRRWRTISLLVLEGLKTYEFCEASILV